MGVNPWFLDSLESDSLESDSIGIREEVPWRIKGEEGGNGGWWSVNVG